MTVNGSTKIPGALGECLRQLRRVDIPISWIPEAEADAVELEKRMALPDLCGGEQLEFGTLRARLREDVVKLIDPIGGMRQADAAGEMVVDLVAHFLREPRIQRGGVALQLEDAPGSREIRAVARRVPGGTRGELIALEQHHIAPTETGEVVQGAATDRAATDHDDSRLALHLCTHRPSGPHAASGRLQTPPPAHCFTRSLAGS